MTGVTLTTLDALGEGVAGRVVRARLERPWGSLLAGAEVALKRPLSAEGAERLAAEVEALTALEGEGLQRLVEAGEDGEGPYLVTELVPGETLGECLRRGALEDDEVRAVGAALAATLARIHRQGWLHGDLAPANVRLDREGRPVLLDLGQACPIDQRPRGRGTPAYLAPEEAAGESKTPASEAWALGVLLWELATGSHPLSPDGRASGVPEGAPLGGIPTPPSIRNPRVSPLLDHWIGELLQEEPGARPALEDLARALGSTGEAGLEHLEDPWAARDSLPLAGRTAALARLEQSWDQASRGEGRWLWLVAQRGLGKTRLVDEAARALRRTSPRPPTYLRVRCQRTMEGRPTHPIRALVRRWLKLGRHTPVGPRERALLAEVLDPDRVEAVCSLLSPVSGPPPLHEVALLADTLTALARSTPLVVFLDEVQRAGEATLSVLGRLIDQLPHLQVLLILGVRRLDLPPEAPLWTLLRRTPAPPRLELSPLEEADLLDLVQQVFVTPDSPLRLARVLFDRTQGKPSRLNALVRTGLDRGLLRLHPEGGLEVVGAAESLPHIEDSRVALKARLERLPPGDRAWLELAAVSGPVVRPARLERVGHEAASSGQDGGAGSSLGAALARLAGGGWLEQGPEGLAFPGSTVRDVVLRAMDEGRRRQLHGLLADALQDRAGASRSFERAHHLHAAGRDEELVPVALALLPAARALGHPRRVLSLTEWALEASVPRTVAEELELHAAAADAAGTLGLRSRERRHLDHLVELDLDPEREPASVARVYLLHGHAAADAGRAGLARGYLRNAALQAERGGELNLASQALRRLAEVELAAGEVQHARETARRARSRARDPITGLHAHLVIGVAALLEDRPVRARAHAMAVLLRCRREPTSLHRSEVEAAASLLSARAWATLARPSRALAFLARASRYADAAGQRALEAEALARTGRALIELGREREAEQALREAHLLTQEIGVGPGEVLARLFLGTLLAEEGSLEGPRLVGRALERATQLGLPRLEAVARAVQARVHLAAGELGQAEEQSRRAVERLARTGAESSDRVVILATRALIQAQGGDGAGSQRTRRELERAIRAAASRVRGQDLSRHLRAGLGRLRDAALDPEGPLYPRAAEGPAER